MERTDLHSFQYISLPFTEGAVWHAYLLWQTFHIIGMRWHGAYEKRLFINLPDDIERIRQEYHVKRIEASALEILINKCTSAYLCPSVRLSENVAFITHCWFNQWGGLLQVHVRLNTMNAKNVLVEYNCRVKY